jgi:hypothetical protein
MFAMRWPMGVRKASRWRDVNMIPSEKPLGSAKKPPIPQLTSIPITLEQPSYQVNENPILDRPHGRSMGAF